MSRISVYLFGGIEPTRIRHLVPHLEATFSGLAAVELQEKPLPLPGRGFSASRQQALASCFTQALAQQARGRPGLALGVSDVDLWAPGLNFVFGEASPAQRCAVFSIARQAGGRAGGQAGRGGMGGRDSRPQLRR